LQTLERKPFSVLATHRANSRRKRIEIHDKFAQYHYKMVEVTAQHSVRGIALQFDTHIKLFISQTQQSSITAVE